MGKKEWTVIGDSQPYRIIGKFMERVPRIRKQYSSVATGQFAAAFTWIAILVYLAGKAETWLGLSACGILVFLIAYFIGKGLIDRIEEDKDASIGGVRSLRYQMILFISEVGLNRVSQDELEKLKSEINLARSEKKEPAFMETYYFWLNL